MGSSPGFRLRPVRASEAPLHYEQALKLQLGAKSAVRKRTAMASPKMLKSPGLDSTMLRASAHVAGEAPAMDRGRTSLGAADTARVTTAPVPEDVRAGDEAGVEPDAGTAAGEGDAKTLPPAGTDSGTAVGREAVPGGGTEGVRVNGRSAGVSVMTAPLVMGTAITGAGVVAGTAYGEAAASFGNHLVSLRGQRVAEIVTGCNIAPCTHLAHMASMSCSRGALARQAAVVVIRPREWLSSTM